GAGLEGFEDHVGVARGGAHAGFGVDADELDAGRHAERDRRLVGERDFEEIADHRRREVTTGRQPRDVARLVVTHVDATDDVGREADEPDILLFVGGAGLAGDRLADIADYGRGAALHDTLHHRGDLIGGHRIDHLLAAVDQRRLGLVVPGVGVATAALALVVLVDGVAVAVLDAVDQGGL